MFWKKPAALAAVAVLSIISLGACASSPPGASGSDGSSNEDTSQPAPDTHYSFYETLPDGQKVLCIWAKTGYGGGLSCDWVGLHGNNQPNVQPTPTS